MLCLIWGTGATVFARIESAQTIESEG